MPHHSSNDGIDEDAINQAEIQLKRFRCYLVIAGVVSFLFGAAVGVVVALNRSESAGNSSGDECTVNNPANAGCIVPECARIKYEELPDYDVTTGMSIADDDDCPPDHLAANALAIRWTNANNDDEMVDADVYFALATFYFSLSGEKWNRAENWLQPSPVCKWHGINCIKDKDDMKDVIVDISLPDNQLVGDVPTQLGLLTSLQSLNLAGNNLGGTHMPSEIGRLVDLETLDLRASKWTGPIPSEIGLCTKLTMLDLWDTDLTGTVPTEISNAKSLGTQTFCTGIYWLLYSIIHFVTSSNLLISRIAEIGKRLVGRAAAYSDWTIVAINHIVTFRPFYVGGDNNSNRGYPPQQYEESLLGGYWHS